MALARRAGGLSMWGEILAYMAALAVLLLAAHIVGGPK
jgi:hypothetical protein